MGAGLASAAKKKTAKAKQSLVTKGKTLKRCPNFSCNLKSLTARVLSEVGVWTRGNPCNEFEKRTMRRVRDLEKRGLVEIYKVTNLRLRLVQK